MEEIEDSEIVKYSNIIRKTDKSVEYDLFEIKVTLKDQKTKIYNVYAEPGTLDAISEEEPAKQEQLLHWFLVERLICKGGLLEQQNNNDYIYAGKLEKSPNGRYSADSFVCIDEKNGITRRQLFEQDLLYLKKANEEENMVNSEKNISNNAKKGKSYAISDVHGMYGSYMEVISKLNPEDTLYILGDVIDRGSNGIKIIQDILKRQEDVKNNPNIVFLCGNHEWRFCKNIERFYSGIELLNSEELSSCSDRKRASILCNYLELKNSLEESRIKVDEIVRKMKESKRNGKLARTCGTFTIESS